MKKDYTGTNKLIFGIFCKYLDNNMNEINAS